MAKWFGLVSGISLCRAGAIPAWTFIFNNIQESAYRLAFYFAERSGQMRVIEVPIDQVKPYENNPRVNDDAVEVTANSIKEFGWQQPIVVDKDNVIIVGHTRLKAAKKLRLKKVPVVIADTLSEQQVKAYRLADNKTGEFADWDVELLDLELSDIVNFDMSDFGFSKVRSNEEKKEIYTKKTDVPHYEITGDEPKISDLFDNDKFEKLKEEIMIADIPEELREFLLLGAYRHVKFDYAKIAEFYAHQPKKVQRLMEHSALVIIDYDNAILNGYLKFKELIDTQREHEYGLDGVDDET